MMELGLAKREEGKCTLGSFSLLAMHLIQPPVNLPRTSLIFSQDKQHSIPQKLFLTDLEKAILE